MALLLVLAGTSQAKEQPSYQKGSLFQMESVPCGFAEKSAKNITGELLGTDSAHKKTQEMLCQEYVLEADRIVYRIRPKDDKHPVLLPVGESAEFRCSGCRKQTAKSASTRLFPWCREPTKETRNLLPRASARNSPTNSAPVHFCFFTI